MNRRHALVILGFALALSIPARALAFEATTSPEPAEVLVRVEVPLLPGPPDPGVEVWLLRYVIDPGVALPASPDLGVTLFHVEAGAITAAVSGQARLIAAGAVSSPVAAGDLTLGPGATLVTGTGNQTGLRNDGQVPASVLALAIFSPVEEMATTPPPGVTPVDEISGIRIQLIGVTRGSLPEVPGTITIERVTWQPGSPVAVDRRTGAEVGALERGAAHLTVTAGEVFLWAGAAPGTGTPEASGPDRLAAGDERALTAGDGYGFSTGTTATWAIDGDEAVTVLRAVVEPGTRLGMAHGRASRWGGVQPSGR